MDLDIFEPFVYIAAKNDYNIEASIAIRCERRPGYNGFFSDSPLLVSRPSSLSVLTSPIFTFIFIQKLVNKIRYDPFRLENTKILFMLIKYFVLLLFPWISVSSFYSVSFY